MSAVLHGAGVSRGIAIGRVHVIERGGLEIPEYVVPETEIDREIGRLEQALAGARQQLRIIRGQIPTSTSADIAAFIDTHLLMLDDAALVQEPARLIRELRYNAERALKVQRDALVSVFEEMNDAYLRTRRDDVDHVVNRIQRILLKQSPLRHEQADGRLHGCVVLADDLTPADTVLMQHQGITAFATEFGGPTSHTAILARSLGIPAIVGLRLARRYIRDDDLLIVDGGDGTVHVNPDEPTLADYRRRADEDHRYYSDLIKLKSAPARTRDGLEIELQANVELPRDFESVVAVGASGIGLYRTEFLYMNRESPPDEEEHLETYLQVLHKVKGLPVTIRTLDLGGDKQVDAGARTGPVHSSPALGLRAVRLCLREPALFRPQLRAIYRASAHGSVRIMIPMLSSAREIDQVLAMIQDIRRELDESGLPYDRSLPVGAMIEVPAAAICADVFARRLDFLSIGTNDLIQYTIAIDRVNDEVNYLYDPLHPAVLRLIHMTLQAGRAAGVPVAMCGEMAGEARYAALLLALGLRHFSIHPSSLLEVKKIIMECDLGRLEELGRRALSAATGSEVAEMLEQT
jgi:phosphotransferase system enzyme I (PtsI)